MLEFNNPKEEVLYKGKIAWLDNRENDLLKSGLAEDLGGGNYEPLSGARETLGKYRSQSDKVQVFLRFFGVEVEDNTLELGSSYNRFQGIKFKGKKIRIKDHYEKLAVKFLVLKTKRYTFWDGKKILQIYLDIYENAIESKRIFKKEPTIYCYDMGLN